MYDKSISNLLICYRNDIIKMTEHVYIDSITKCSARTNCHSSWWMDIEELQMKEKHEYERSSQTTKKNKEKKISQIKTQIYNYINSQVTCYSVAIVMHYSTQFFFHGRTFFFRMPKRATIFVIVLSNSCSYSDSIFFLIVFLFSRTYINISCFLFLLIRIV